MNISRRLINLTTPINNFLKANKFFYKKRMGINHIESQKLNKIDNDFNELNQVFDWMEEGAEIQTPGLKLEKGLEKIMLSEETKTNLRNLKQDFQKSRELLKKYIRDLKTNLLKESEKKPEILQYDPELYKKLSQPQGLEEFFKKYKPKIIDNSYFDKPELNKKIIDYDENAELSLTESYLMNVFNEDEFRYNIHMDIVNDFEKIYQGDINEMVEYNEVHIGERTKKQFKEYIKLVRTDQFREYSTSYAKTVDNYRVDVGLVISRKPIFLGVNHEDMEFGKYRRQIMKKYHMDPSKYIEDIETLNDMPGVFWDACSGQFKISSDNKPNIRKWNSLEKKYDFYCSNSKHYTLVDPNVTNPQSIQYESLNSIYLLFHNKFINQYEFPSTPIYHGDNFRTSKYKLFIELSKEKYKIYFEDEHPIFSLTRKFHDYELENPKNKGFNGVRTFYFPAYHFRGTPQVYLNNRHPYDDFVFTTKMNLNKVTTEPYYHGIIHALSEAS